MAQRNGSITTCSGQCFSLSSQKLAIEYLPIASLNPDPRNPRLHKAKQIAQIAKSVQTFGFNVPVLVDATLQVIAGHGRLEACRLLGIKEVPTILLDHLTPQQVQAFLIADNRLTENAEWDNRMLGEQLKILAEAEINFSIEATGFEMAEIDLLIEGLAPDHDGESDPADEVPEAANLPRVSKVGDLWLLGKHRVLCADTLDPSNFSKLMLGRKANVVFTDPPFNVKIDGNVSGKGQTHHREFAMASGEMSVGEFTDFLTRALCLLADNSSDGSIHFVCMDWRHIKELTTAGEKAYDEFKNLCVWMKNNAGMGSLYRSQHELIFVFKHGNGGHRNNIKLGQFGRNRSNVWQYPSANSFCKTEVEGNLLALHPTPKPVAMVADAILDCSARGDLVLDSFLGSGTTVIAAERTGRVCYGMEIDLSTSTPSFAAGRRSRVRKRYMLRPAGHSMRSLRRWVMLKSANPGYQVGYGKPPKRTQFRSGQSGNPKGRPKGSLNLATLLERELRERVIINENGRRKTISKMEAAIKQLVNKAASGDLVALKLLNTLVIAAEEQAMNASNQQTKGMSEDDQKVLQGILKRLGCGLVEASDETLSL